MESMRALQAAEKLGVSGEIGEKHPSGAKQGAENGLHLTKIPERHPAGAKAQVNSAAFTARLKSCPDAYGGSDKSFSATCKAHADLDAFKAVRAKAPTYQSCPDAYGSSDKSFSAACLAPEACFSAISPENQPFSAASLAPEGMPTRSRT
jgi:hypothetical protein